MRYLPTACFALLVAHSALAQRSQDEVVIRGCLEASLDSQLEMSGGLVLVALPPSRQTFDAPPDLRHGQRYSLTGDRRALQEMVQWGSAEVEVTGVLNPLDSSDLADPTVIERPGIGRPSFGEPPPPVGRQRSIGGPPQSFDVIEVSEYRRRGAGADCRR